MKCPKCGSEMTIGSSHADYGSAQWECHNCGYGSIIERERIRDEIAQSIATICQKPPTNRQGE